MPGSGPALPASRGPVLPEDLPLAAFPSLVRVGGLPARAVPRPGEALVAALERVGGLDQELETARQGLLDPLYQVVPALGRAERREVLRAKRNVYHGRATGMTPGTEAALTQGLGSALARWDHLVRARQEAYQLLEAEVEADLSRSREVLAASLDEPGYLRAVAVAAPALVSTLARRGRRLDDPRVLRTLYTMAARAALKTSPFSGLTTVGQAGAPARGRSLCTVAVHLAHGVLAATAREVDPDGGLLLETAPVRAAAGTEELLGVVAEHAYANGMHFRSEEVLPATWLLAAHEALVRGASGETLAPSDALAPAGPTEAGAASPYPEALPGGLGAWPGAAGSRPVTVRRACALLGGRDPRTRLRRLLASGAVVPRAPWSQGASPFLALAGALSPAQRHTWEGGLRWLSGLDQAVSAGDAVQRAELLTRAGRLAGRIFPDGELGERPGGVLYEDCEPRTSWPDPVRDGSVGQDVAVLAGLVDPWVTRSHIYDLMVERFVACYGRGGVCEDPLAFVMTLAHAPDGDTEMMRASARDYAVGADPGRAAMPGGASACPRNLGAYLQPVLQPVVESPTARTGTPPAGSGRLPAGPGQVPPGPGWQRVAGTASGGPAQRDAAGQADQAGRGLTVVNAFTSGTGALHARFHRLLGEGYRLRLARQIRAAWGTDRVLELPVSTECHTGQAMACGVLPPLGLPGEPGADDAVSLSALRLAHDPATHTLFLADSQGPVGLAYLGLVARNLLGGYLAWLVLLSDPWSRLAPFADHWTARRREMSGPLPDRVVHEPRATHGRLVTRRESWTLPAGEVSGILGTDLAASLRAADRLRDRLGAPAQVYVHQHLPTQGATYDEHKPLYVDLRSPASLLSLRGWVDPRAEHLSLVEALPAREELAGATDGGEPTALEYLVTLQWPKTAGGA